MDTNEGGPFPVRASVSVRTHQMRERERERDGGAETSVAYTHTHAHTCTDGEVGDGATVTRCTHAQDGESASQLRCGEVYKCECKTKGRLRGHGRAKGAYAEDPADRKGEEGSETRVCSIFAVGDSPSAMGNPE